jgi:DNA replication protein DnaC
MHDFPPKPQGICEYCKFPLDYEPNPKWDSIKHLFKTVPARGYWFPVLHVDCERTLEELQKRDKDSLTRKQGNESVKGEMRELGFARILAELPNKEFRIETENRAAFEKMTNWQHPEQGVLLLGPPGRGKSHLMALTGRHWVGAGLTVAFQTMSGLLALLRRGYDEDLFDERLQFLSSKVDILMLDDLGAEKNSAWGEEKLYMIIDTRLNSKRPLFVTTNLTESELEERYHPRIASRLKEMCSWVKVGGPDWRGKGLTY